MRFRVVVRWAVMEDFEVDLEVAGDVYADAGNHRGHPDTWRPPCVVIDVDEVRDASIGGLFPRTVVDHLAEDEGFLDEVNRAVTSRK
jgi:hypothetical protein